MLTQSHPPTGNLTVSSQPGPKGKGQESMLTCLCLFPAALFLTPGGGPGQGVPSSSSVQGPVRGSGHSYHITYFNMLVSLNRRLVTQNISRTMAISKATPMAVMILMSNIFPAPGQGAQGGDWLPCPQPAQPQCVLLTPRKNEPPPTGYACKTRTVSQGGPGPRPAWSRGGRGFICG